MKRNSSPAPDPALTAAALPPLLGGLRPLGVAALVLFIATLCVFGDLIFAGGDKILSVSGTDTWGVFVGWCQFTVAEMNKGNFLPLWNPHLYSGAPCLGGFQEALLYPTTYLLYFLPIPQAINFGIIIHVFLAGLFTYMWMARRGLHPAAAIVSGLVFMFGGGYFMHITAGHLPNLRTMVWAPLIFLAIDDLCTTRSLRGAWLGAFAVAMQIFAGHPQYTYITALIAGPYALLGVWRAPSRPRALLGLALMGIGGVGLSAIQLFTGLAAAHESIRSGLRFEVANTFPFPPENLVTLALPSFFGQISDHMYWGRWLLWEDCLFIGAVGVTLVIYGIVRGERSQRPFTILAFLLVSLILAFGNYTPLYRLLYAHLPGINSFRGISKVAFMAALFLANLAGVGFDRLLREERIAKKPPLAIAGAAILLIFIGLVILHWGAGGPSGKWARSLYRIHWFAETYPDSSIAGDGFFTASSHIVAKDMFWCAGVCAALAVLWFLSTRNRKLVYAIALLAAVDLIAFTWNNRFTFPMSEVQKAEDALRTDIDYEQLHKRIPSDARFIINQPSNILGIGRDEGWGNDPMVMRRYAEFMDIGQDRPADELVQKGFTRPGRVSGMARVFFPMVKDGKEQWAVGRPYLHRAQLIESAEIIPDGPQMLKRIGDKSFNAGATVLLEGPVSPMPTPDPAATGPAGVVTQINDLSTDAVEVVVDVSRPAILLMTDTYSKDWRAEPVDSSGSQTYEIVPADYAFRGVALKPGHHDFILRYVPRSFSIGVWVSLMSLIGWIGAGLMLMGWVKRNPSAESSRRASSRKRAKGKK